MTLTPHLKHIILAVLIAAVVLLVAWKVIAYEGGIAHDQRVLAEERLKNDLAVAKVQADASKAAQSDLDQKLAASNAAVARLSTEVAQLRNDLATRRQQDAALAPPELAARWQGLIGKGVVTAAPGGILADDAASHETVSELEELPVLRQENKKISDVSATKDTTLISAQNLVTATKDELTTCKKTIVDADAVCTAKLKEQAAKARKRSILYAVGSFIGGILFGRKL